MNYIEIIAIVLSNFFSFLLGWLVCAIFSINKEK